jgi:hypothetical protein
MAAEGNPANDAMLQTLNYALGNLGGGQKSWMQAANPQPPPLPSDLTVRPLPFTVARRGRPAKKRGLLPTTTEAPRPSIELLAEEQPSSNSTSPQLANTVTGHNTTGPGPSAVTVFPSPTPSEEPMGVVPSPPQEPVPTSPDFLELLDLESRHCAPDTPSTAGCIESAVGMRPGGKRRYEEAGAQVEKRGRFAGSGQEQPAVPPASHARLQQDLNRRSSISQAIISSPPISYIQSRMPSLGQAADSPIHNSYLVEGHRPSQTSQTPFQAQAPFGHPGTVSRDAPPMARMPVDPGTMQFGTYPDPRSDWYSERECLHVMSQFEQSFSVAPGHPRDGRRLAVLQGATKLCDWPYLFMHQLYCLFDFNSSLVPEVIRTQPGLDHALHVMREVLDENNRLSPAVLHFFANYPYPFETIAKEWPVTTEFQVQAFMYFVNRSQNYETFKLSCERRRFPPLAGELAHYLGLESITFQLRIFTAILRNLFGAAQSNLRTRYEKEATSIFQENQSMFCRRLGEGHTIEQQLRMYNKSDLRRWGSAMKRVVENFHDNLQLRILASTYVQQLPPQNQQYSHTAEVDANMPLRAPNTFQQRSDHPSGAQPRPRGRPHLHPISAQEILPSQPRGQAAPTAQSAQSRGQVQQQEGRVPLLPPPGWIQAQQRQPNPARFSLHQAHLRSPILKAHTIDSPLYQFVQDFIKTPAPLLNAHRAVEKWTFTLDLETIKCIAATESGPASDQRLIDAQSKTLRLRCIKWPDTELPSEHVWASTDTSWIPHSYLTLNGTPLQQRKKVYHGKDLPIDITSLVKEGPNLLEMTVMAQSKDLSYQKYLVAIESLGIVSHDSLRHHCLTQSRLPADQVLADIKRKLSGTGEDDDFAIVESNLTIGLFDPFSASKICDIPVRSKACLHNDCFDLETFLVTRRRHGDASVADAWRCPICNADARPQHLVVDGFIQDVKTRLESQGLGETRHIVIQQDGTWKPKVEVRDPNGVSDRGASDGPPTPIVARVPIPVYAEVIDLSD